MKKLAAMTVLVMLGGSSFAQVIFTEDFNDWYDTKQVQWDENWIGVGNNNGFQGDGAGKVDSLFAWRGATYTGASVGSLAVGESVVIQLDLKLDLNKLSNSYKQMFGLTTGPTNLAGATFMAAPSGANALGFDVHSSAWPGPTSGQSTSNGQVKVLSYFNAGNVDGLLRNSEDWGLAPTDGDITGDEMRLTYTATKTATANEWDVDIDVLNLATLGNWTDNFTVVNSTAYNATEMWFYLQSHAGHGADLDPTSTLDNISVEVIPEPATLGLIGLAGIGLYVRRRFHG